MDCFGIMDPMLGHTWGTVHDERVISGSVCPFLRKIQENLSKMSDSGYDMGIKGQ